MEHWIKQELEKHLTEDGVLPPPWTVFPDTHPYSLMWRMGAGETFIMVWGQWWRTQTLFISEGQKVEYFRRFPPPPRWLVWMIDVLWNLRPWEATGGFDHDPYFEKATQLGFGSRAEFEADLDDPRWLEEDED